jgi:PmbA protein
LSNAYETDRLLRDPRGKDKLGIDPRRYRKALAPRNGFRCAGGSGRHFDRPPSIVATNLVLEGRRTLSAPQLVRRVRDGLYIGRIWYTYPINGLAAGDFTCTVIGDSFLIQDGQLAAPLKPNTVRINDNILRILHGIAAVGARPKATFGWAADEIVYAPEVLVEEVRITEIAEFTEHL